MADTKLRLEAAAHETRCRECRVTWWSWLLRLLDRDEGYTPLPRHTLQRAHEENRWLRDGIRRAGECDEPLAGIYPCGVCSGCTVARRTTALLDDR